MSAWVDRVLLSGLDSEDSLNAGEMVSRAALREEVQRRQQVLETAGLRPGGSVALRLPPSMAYIANLLAAWRIGAQVSLLDHRLTQFEIDRALDRLDPQVVVSPDSTLPGGLRAFYDVTEVVTRRAGSPATTGHAVIQLSSGSTGPSKVIARTAQSLIDEIERYSRIDGVPQPGERVVLLASVVHVLGLVGGLLYCLHTGVELAIPQRLSVDAILKLIAASDKPTTILGVPFHIELLASVTSPPPLPMLKRMTTGGELIRAEIWERFTRGYAVPLGNMYGMTEAGVIGTDLFGEHRPCIRPAPGITVREEDGELLVRLPESPYLGLADPGRWDGGWLRTKDAGIVDPATGLVTVMGRLDSQVSVGGLKVDLTEVEHTLAGLPGVQGAVVVYDGGIEAYAVVPDAALAQGVDAELARRLAAYKRPKVIHFVEQLPRTATGKLVRAQSVLKTAK